MSWWRGESRRQRATPIHGRGRPFRGPPPLPVPPEPQPPGFTIPGGLPPQPVPGDLRYDRVS